jgi:hypothetical protein
MRLRTLALAACALSAAASAVGAAPRAVVELFTSPYCSSCPRADALFVDLARDPDLITLVMPVDTWNRPGRTDELARPEFTRRQAAYADARRNQNLRMTPQVIGITKAIARTSGALSVPVDATAIGDELVVSVGGGHATKRGAFVTVLPYSASRDAPLHGGRSIEYANLVGHLVPLGTWNGKPLEQRVRIDDFAQYDGVVVLLQTGTRDRPGAIIGAARVPYSKGPKA